MTTVEIFSQGEELVTGQTLDTNAGWLSRRLVQMGFTVTRHTTVGDKLDDLVGLLKEVSLRTDCCICTGGLGPTIDDLTAEAVAIAFDRPLQFDQIAYQQISAYFKHRNRPMAESNRKQALLPQDSERLDNSWGTAPGFTLQQGRCWFAFVPGVPYEMKQLFQEHIKPSLQARFSVTPWQLIIIKTIGIGESDIQERLCNHKLPEQVQLSFRTASNEIQTKLLFPPAFLRAELEAVSRQVAERIGDKVFTIEGGEELSGDLISLLDKLLSAQQQTLAVAETLSQGLIAGKCIGANWLTESLFCRDVNHMAHKLALPKSATFDTDEQRSQLAITYAQQLREISGSHIALVQLCFQPSSELIDKQSMAVLYTALVNATNTFSKTTKVSGPIKRKQNQAALYALDLVRRFIIDNH
jgi:competence/damage-inducible protein CinA-like protein